MGSSIRRGGFKVGGFPFWNRPWGHAEIFDPLADFHSKPQAIIIIIEALEEAA
jgi:hypothetical protein